SGGRVHQDIVDGLDHLAARGIGDPENTAIVGHSYGGFAALVGAIEHPGRYRAAVATAPPIDLVRAFRDLAPEHETPSGLSLAVWMREVFVDLDDQEAVAEERRRSPEMRLGATGVPLLLMAGGLDEKVSVVDVRYFAGELAALDHDVSLLVDDEAGHSFDTPHMPKARAVLTERFLGRWLGGDVVPVEDPELDAYLASRMVLTGPSLAAEPKSTSD
ncbi:MAG: alpha/beta fold hydrolase, partial [Acidobacteriota bacterium]